MNPQEREVVKRGTRITVGHFRRNIQIAFKQLYLALRRDGVQIPPQAQSHMAAIEKAYKEYNEAKTKEDQAKAKLDQLI